MNRYKSIFGRLWQDAMQHNKEHILALLEPDPRAQALDLGCYDGSWSLQLASRLGVERMSGIDIALAESTPNPGTHGDLRRVQGNLNRSLPFASGSFDVVHSNQVIEHLVDPDVFVGEIRRVLKPGGYAVISTENLSSWHNIFALTLGFQAFSQHISAVKQVGNPLALHSGEEIRPGFGHMKIFTLRGLKDICGVHGLIVERSRGAGYYPFFGRLSRWLCRMDPTHSHFITVKARKPLDAS